VPIVVSLLRGINVGGHNKIRMADLRDLYIALGMRNPRTILQSGNVVFACEEGKLARAKGRIEAGIQEHFGLDVQVILRSSAEFRAVIDKRPFSDLQLEEPRKAAIVFLTAVVDGTAVEQLRENNPGREAIVGADRELFVYYTDGMARSKLDNKRMERALGVGTTMRNWNTCQRILKLLDEFDS